MKSMLYAGAALMIGASIYGVVDFQKTRHKKEFTEMYKENSVPEPVGKTVSVSSEEKKNLNSKTNVTKKDPTGKSEEVVSINPIANDEKMTVNGKEIASANVTVTPSENSTPVVKPKKRRFSTRLFSRGALDERYIKDEIKSEEPKTKVEPTKTENKEQ